MKEKLTNDDFCRAAKKLRCDVAAIKAVANTESAGNGFYSDGFPVILFERHLFKKFTNGKYNKSHPHLSGPAGNYGAAGQNQRNKFNEAFALDADAAMKSCSWGKFQILASNFKICGFNSAGAFVDAMKESEGRQLDAFVNFVIGNHLDDDLRNLNWAGFARGYNGSGYKKNKYDTKMATAYNKFKKEGIDCSGKISPDQPTSKPEETPSEVVVHNPDNVVINEEGATPNGDTVSVSVTDEGVKVETNTSPTPKEKVAVVAAKKPTFFSRLSAKATAAITGNAVFQLVMDKAGTLAGIVVSPTLWYFIVGTVVLITLIWLISEAYKTHQDRNKQKELDKLLVEQNSTPNNIVQLVNPDDAELFSAKGWKIVNRGDKLDPSVAAAIEDKKEDE